MFLLLIILALVIINFIFLGMYYFVLFLLRKNNEHKLVNHMKNHYCGIKSFCYISLIPLIGVLIHIWGIIEIIININKNGAK